MRYLNAKEKIFLFLIFAFGLPAICLFLTQKYIIFQIGMPKFILLGLQVMSPTFSALIVVAIVGGGRDLKVFLKKCYLDNIRLKYILLAMLLPLTVLLIAKITSFIVLKQTTFISAISTRKIIVIVWALVAEEVGWRGFLQEKLDKLYGNLVTPFLVGMVWAFWHYHLFLSGNTSAPLLLFLIGCIADSYGYYWVTIKSKGNVIPASIWHFTDNLFFNLFLINPEYNNGSSIPYMLFVFYSIIMAVGISIWGGLSERKNIQCK